MLLPPTLIFETLHVAEAEHGSCPKSEQSQDAPQGQKACSMQTPLNQTPCMDIDYTENGRPIVNPAYLASLSGWREDPLIASALYGLYEFVQYEARGEKKIACQKGNVATVLTPQESIKRSPRLYLYGESASSLDVAHELARQGKLEPWDAVMVTSQSSGRGQLRRAWDSPCGNLYAAWRLPLEFPLTQGYAALVVGTMVAEALSTIRVPLELKWPNDILLQGKKVGGILLEERDGVLLAGIGINALTGPPEDCLREVHAVAATSLHEQGYGFTPLTLFCSLVNMGRFWYRKQVHDAQKAHFPQCMEKYLAWRHKNIVVHGGNSDIKNGTIVGIAPCGGLKVLHNGVESVLDSGSIVLA